LRGLDPRFSLADGFADLVIRYVFLAASQTYVALYGVLALWLWRTRSRSSDAGPAVRWAAASTFLGFAAGYGLLLRWWLDPSAGRWPELVVAHAVGFHGAQWLLLLAWLGVPPPRLQLAGRLWAAGAALLLVHTASYGALSLSELPV